MVTKKESEVSASELRAIIRGILKENERLGAENERLRQMIKITADRIEAGYDKNLIAQSLYDFLKK